MLIHIQLELVEFAVVLDMDEGTLAFVVDGQYLGIGNHFI